MSDQIHTPDSGSHNWARDPRPEFAAAEAVRDLLPEYSSHPRPGGMYIDPDDHYTDRWIAAHPQGLESAEPQVIEHGDVVIGVDNSSYLGSRKAQYLYAAGQLKVTPGYLDQDADFLSTFMRPAPAHGLGAVGWMGSGYGAKPYTIELVDREARPAILSVSAGTTKGYDQETYEYDSDNERVSVGLALPRSSEPNGYVTYTLRYRVENGIIVSPNLWRALPRERNIGAELIYEIPRDAPAELHESAAMQHWARHHAEIAFESAEGRQVLGTMAAIADLIKPAS